MQEPKMPEIRVMLDKETEQSFRNYFYNMLMDIVDEVKKDAGLDTEFLKVMKAAKWAGVSYPTFNEWVEMGLPKAELPGGTFYSKKTIDEWRRLHEK